MIESNFGIGFVIDNHLASAKVDWKVKVGTLVQNESLRKDENALRLGCWNEEYNLTSLEIHGLLTIYATDRKQYHNNTSIFSEILSQYICSRTCISKSICYLGEVRKQTELFRLEQA